MKYTIELSKTDTERLRMLVSQAYQLGKESASTETFSIQNSLACLLSDVSTCAETIAKTAFSAALNAPRLD